MIENQELDKKSIRLISGANPAWNDLAKDCVAFANAYGGRILIGIEDADDMPPPDQKIGEGLPQKVQKMVQGRTLNVSVVPKKCTAENGGEYIEVLIQRTASTIASTSDGKYYIRIDDDCKPILPDELGRLLVDKNAFIWETQQAQKNTLARRGWSQIGHISARCNAVG
jgi:ATP-dependent DNA helicase RecG